MEFYGDVGKKCLLCSKLPFLLCTFFSVHMIEHFIPIFQRPCMLSAAQNSPLLLLFRLWIFYKINCSRISSVSSRLDCGARGHGYDSQGRTNTQGLKITEKWRYFLCPVKVARPSCGSDYHKKQQSCLQLETQKIVSPISNFILNTLTLKKQWKCKWIRQ